MQVVSKGAGYRGLQPVSMYNRCVLSPLRGLVPRRLGLGKSLGGLHMQLKKRNKIPVENQTQL